MKLLDRLLGGLPRLQGEVRFVLGAALVGALVGLGVALLTGNPHHRLAPSPHPAAHYFALGAEGFGIGWWGGLLWSLLLVLQGRRHKPAAPLVTLVGATWIAACCVVSAAALAYWQQWPKGWAIGGGLVVGTIAARTVVGRAASRQLT